MEHTENLQEWSELYFNMQGAGNVRISKYGIILDIKSCPKSINIPEGIIGLGKACFSGCKNLVQITIPKSVYIIDEYVFTNCENLETINIYHTHDKFLENIKYGNRAKINYLD